MQKIHVIIIIDKIASDEGRRETGVKRVDARIASCELNIVNSSEIDSEPHDHELGG